MVISNHMKSTTLFDTGTHRVDLIEDGTDEKCDWVAIYKMDRNGETIGVMRLYGSDVEPYKNIANKKVVPETIKDVSESIVRAYERTAAQYRYFVKAGIYMKAEYYRGKLDAILGCLKRIDPDAAGLLEECKISKYY